MRSLANRALFVGVLFLLACPAFSQTFTGVNIGGDTGTTQVATGGHDLRSSGRDIGGTADQFQFAYQQRTGDFDVKVRVEDVTITDAFVQAGLVARGGLEVNAPFAGVFSSSAQISAFFEHRPNAGANTTIAAPAREFPVNYPQMYLRLRRVGNTFTGYGSFDGQSWQQLGLATVTMPSSVFFGMGLASHDTNKVSTAKFRELGNVTGAGTFTYRGEGREPMGPANRRTGLVFSEIMYNPAPRADTNVLEFIEVYNGESIFVDLTGWRIAGGVEYQFPDGFTLEAGQFAVIAADPATVQQAYGISGVLGPYSGRLNNAGDGLLLLNASGAIRLEVEYDTKAPWPSLPDGSGHSLVLTRPSYGEDDPRAWGGSEMAGGSPGQVDAMRPSLLKAVVINEFLAHTDDPEKDFIELYNASNVSVDISGCVLTDDITTNRFRIPNGTFLGARSFASFDQDELGFALSSGGETIFLVSPDASSTRRVIDSMRFEGQENGISTGRAPDGSPTLRRLAASTPGLPNADARVEEVVINELMYHPISGDDNDQYIEIHNRSGAAVDLSGWTFSDGVDFEFPEGANIPANGYVVVARDRTRFLGNYPTLNTNLVLGNFDGSLSRSSERLALSKRDFVTETNLNVKVTNTIQIAVSEVLYHDGGRWAELADGGGSSLELIDARADTMLPGNWAASDESQKAPWTTVEFTGRLDNGNGAQAANRFFIAMLGAGECLIDDVEFIPSGSTNILINGDFDNPNSTWNFYGNHRGSAIVSGGAFSGPNVLFVRAPGDGDTANNTIRGNLTRTLNSGIATIRAKVRWISGWPEVLMRIRGNWIELPARMTVPTNLGTPGAANSRRRTNHGPAIYDVTHSPALPRSNEAVTVTARASDPDGVAPRVLYRIDPSATLTTVFMRDDGLNGDALGGDGLFSAIIPGQSSGGKVAFRILASDDAAPAQTSVFPPNAPEGECLIRWGDTVPFGSFVHYHMWWTDETETTRDFSPDLDNTFRDTTLVYGNFRVIYNTGFRDKGSPYHNGGGDFALTVPKNEPLLGIDDRVFASTGNGGSEGTGMKTDVSNWIAQQIGLPYLHNHYMRLYRNGTPHREVMYDMEQPNRYYAQSWYGGGGVKDDLFKISIWFEFDDFNSGFSPTGATLNRFLSDGQFKLARYRWNWQIRPSTDTANDYSTIFNLVTAANSSVERLRTLPHLADMEEWMRMFAYHRFIGNWDSYSYQVGQNMFMYAPLGQRATLLPWDIDFVLGEGNGPGNFFTAGQDGIIQTLFNVPAYRRMLWRAYQDAANGPALPQNFQPQVDARREALIKNGIVRTAPTSITSYLNSARNSVNSQLAASDAPDFSITSNGGLDFVSTEPTVVLAGRAPFAVASIEVNGVPFPVTWTSVTAWQITVPLGGRTNILEFVGRDLRGKLVPGASDTITIEYNGAVPQPDEWVVINEIMYNPDQPDAEFIELHNRHPSFAFDLSGFRMSGVDFVLPPGSFIQPNGFLVLVENRAVFGNVYDPLLPVLGPYAGSLQRGGETLRLIKPGATPGEEVVIDEVRYENLPPWPVLADGFGPSLQLIDAAQDNRRAGNWASTSVNNSNRATPGRVNAVQQLIEAYPELWLNEIAPVNLAGPTDGFGEREPWLEIYNGGSTPIDLSGLALSDDGAQLGKWQFPAGTSILPGAFRLVWLDGEVVENSAAEFHTSFRVSSTNGVVVLSRAQGATSATVDHLRFLITSPENSFGLYPDGDPRRRRMLYVQTPGAPNDETLPNVNVVINEWMAAGHSVLRDPADNQFEDWIELYNAGTNTVDLSGFYLSDSSSEPIFRIPNGYTIGPKQFKLIWADNETIQNAPGRDLHVDFALGAGGEEIAIFTPDEQLLHSVSFGQQTQNISEGRYPDGSSDPFALFITPTPGAPNSAQFANRSPVITAIADASLDEGGLYSITVVATDPDQPAQQLTYSLVTPSAGMTINANNGQLSWQTTEASGPGVYTITVRVTDNGSPQRAATTSFRINVREVNQAPAIADIQNITVDEGTEVHFSVQATDGDFPAQALAYSLEPGAPSGVLLDAQTGEFSWTPTEAQGPGNYNIAVRVTDNGTPAAFATRAFQITVRDVNNPPIIQPITANFTNEGTPFTVQVVATDPENAPQFTYSIDSGPAGMTINPTTGLISWTPDEAAGPRDYSIVVRVSEAGGSPSATTSFQLGVREVNTAPVLGNLVAVVVQPGDLLLITNRATDVDIPAQALSYSAFNLPEGATLDPITGVIRWLVPEDPLVGTHRISVVVSDNATPALVHEQSFDLIVHAPIRVVINEVMHRPTQNSSEYVELANISAFNSVDISGWRLEGYNFTFPANTILAPNSFVCVARFLTGFRGAYGPNPRAFGDANVTLPADGGLLRLIRPASGNIPEEVIDEVEFSLSAPWPAAAATSGASLQLIDPWEDNRRVSNWGASSQTVTNSTFTIVPIGASWRYWQSAASPGAAWHTIGYSDMTWSPGTGLLYVENEALPAPKSTPLSIGLMTYYFRTKFSFAGSTTVGAMLRIAPVIDDGAIFYLNGNEVYRLGMPDGAVSGSTPASRTVGNAVYEGPFDVPATGLINGENVIAVEVHQSGAGSTDIVFGSEIQLISTTPVSFTPGAPNSVRQDLPTVPPVWINEVHPINTTGITDNAGERDPWLELYNASDAEVSLADWFLSDDAGALGKFNFPADAVIPAGGHLLVWMDGSSTATLPEIHANFHLSSFGGRVYLSVRQNGIPSLVDYLQYSAVANQSFGAERDGQPIGRKLLGQSSPGTSNGGPAVRPTLVVEKVGTGVRVTWDSVLGQTYNVDATTNLQTPDWQSVLQTTGTGGSLTYTDSLPNNNSARFFRIRTN